MSVSVNGSVSICVSVFLCSVSKTVSLLHTSLVVTDAAVPPSIVMESLVKVSLPQHLVVLNASQSHDDFGIVSYEWSPHPQNLAIGVSE